MTLLNHCPDIFPRLNFSIFVSGLLCEFVQHLLLHIFLSQLFNYCLLSTIYFFFQPKLLPPRTVVFIPIESFLMFLAQKLMYFPRPLHQFSFHQSLIRVLDLFFFNAKNTIIKTVMTFETGMEEVGAECLWALDLKRICFLKT